MKRYASLILFVFLLTACGGGTDSGRTDADSDREAGEVDEEEQSQSSSDGTRLLVPGVGGVDVVDLDAESQEPLIEGLGQIHGLRLIGDTLWFVEGTDLVAADPKSGDLKGRVSIPEGVVELVVGGDTAWVLTGIAGVTSEIALVDTDSMTQVGTIVAPELATYRYVAALGDDVWAFGGDFESSTTVAKLDADSLTQTTTSDIGVIADSMTSGGNAIWVGGTIPAFISDSGNPESGIAKLDPGSGELLLTIELGAPSDHIVVSTGFGHLWATKGLDATLYKIDLATGEIVDSVDTGDGAAGIPLEIIFTADLVWVFNTTDDTITAYDPDSLEFDNGINVPAFSAAPVFAP